MCGQRNINAQKKKKLQPKTVISAFYTVVHVKTKILPAPAPTGMIARGNNMKSDPAAARSQAQPAQKLGVDSRAQGKNPTTTRVHEFDRVWVLLRRAKRRKLRMSSFLPRPITRAPPAPARCDRIRAYPCWRCRPRTHGSGAPFCVSWARISDLEQFKFQFSEI